MFWFDSLLLKWVIAQCAKVGGAFFLGPLEGAIIYALVIMWGVNVGLNSNKKKGAK